MDINELEEFDRLKTKILKYVIYKKRTKKEIREKFKENSGNMLENIIEYLEENNYINDKKYIQKAVKEYIALKNLSIKEIKYKLLSKGLLKDDIDDYICQNKAELLEYEVNSAKNIFLKKENTLSKQDIIVYLKKKGYLEETINLALS